MLRALLVAFLAIWSSLSSAASESTMSLLDNRFRVDPTIEQITFLVYREQSSQPVVLVRPDGKKYYAWALTTMYVGIKKPHSILFPLITLCQVHGRLWGKLRLKITSA